VAAAAAQRSQRAGGAICGLALLAVLAFSRWRYFALRGSGGGGVKGLRKPSLRCPAGPRRAL
jgi:hypothetical protein